LENAVQRSKADPELRAEAVLPVKPVRRRQFLHGSPPYAANAGPSENWQRIIGADDQPVVQLRMPPQPTRITSAWESS